MGKLDGKVAIVTGASRGIGAEIAKLFASEGSTVICAARTIREGDHPLEGSLEGTIADIKEAGGEATAVAVNISLTEECEKLVQDTRDIYGPADVLVNNAGYAYRAEIGELDLDAMRRMFNVNVFGLVDITNRVVPLMKERGEGDIVNIASTSGMKGGAGGTSYGASKWALRGITQAWQAELRPQGIRATCVCPSEVQTDFDGKTGRSNPNKLFAPDIAATIMAAVDMPRRVLWPELAVFAANPWKEG